MNIDGVNNQTFLEFGPNAAEQKAEVQEKFADDLKNAIQGVQENLASADQTAVAGLVGNASPHDVVIAMTKADLSFRLLTQVRNKVVDAYKEIMRMNM